MGTFRGLDWEAEGRVGRRGIWGRFKWGFGGDFVE